MEPQTQPANENQPVAGNQPEQLSFLGMINTTLDRLGTLKLNRKDLKEKLDSELKQSAEFVTASEKAQVETAHKKEILKRLSQNPNVIDIQEQIKNVTEAIKDEMDTLGVSTLSYVRETNEQTIVRNGQTYSILLNAKLKKAKKK